MKDKLLTIKNGLQLNSCGVCHDSTIQDGWCANCIDVPGWKYTANPVQTEVYKILQENPKQSFIVASKTGTGKSICAYEAIKQFYNNNTTGKILMLMPLKQLAHEKVDDLNQMFPNKKVLELTGDTTDTVGFGKRRNQMCLDNDMIIMSFEMFDSLTRKPEVYSVMSQISMLVVDEIHSIGDFSRGGKLDGAITRFLLKSNEVQIVALSATFDNIEDLQKYFDQFLTNEIKIITSEFTPIKVHVDQELHVYNRENLSVFTDLVGKYMHVPGGIMCMQLSIPGCKKLAAAVNSMFGEGTAKVHFSELQKDDKYRTVDEFNEGKFKVLCCTPTLLAGVNVAASAIILNVSFFNPLTMDDAILPPTSIRQAIGRVGRPPRYKEGWVSYVCKEQQADTVREVLQSENTINGALNHALEQVLNIEVSMKTQTFDELVTWYQHTFSGFSLAVSAERFGEALKFLKDHEYVANSQDHYEETKQPGSNILTILPKGKACAKYFIDPRFFEDCYMVLNNTAIDSTEGMMTSMETLFALPTSPFNWNERKSKQLEDYSGFTWMRDEYSNFDFNRIRPQVQWAEQIQFAMSSIHKASTELKLPEMTTNSELIETCMDEGLIPYPLVRLKLKLEKLGLPHLGSKYILFLHLNGVRVDKDDILTGPDSFRSPQRAVYIMSADDYYNHTFTDVKSRYENAALSLKKYYGISGVEIVAPGEDNGW